MSQETELTIFLYELESDITEIANPDGDPSSANFRESVFTEIISEELAVSGILESPVVCHFEGGTGSGSFKVNGYSLPEEDSRLDLFVTHHVNSSDRLQTINASHIEAAFNKLERYLGKAMTGHHTNLEPGLDPYLMTERIYGRRERIDRVNFSLFTNARLAQRRERERKREVHGLTATFEVWDLERFRRLRASGMSSEPLNVGLKGLPKGGLPAVKLDLGAGGCQTWVTVFPGKLLFDLYEEYGSQLLDLNVRSYLQARGKVNKGILETLRQSPEDFMAYNNGITVVAEGVEAGELPDGSVRILELKGMQIVNGGQTTASIHRAVKDFQVDLSRVYVQGKITVVEQSRFQEVVPLISRYSNSQNKVSESDLRANHPFHVGMERVARREWAPDQKTRWFYERARGSYQTARSREGTTPSRRNEFDKRYPSSQRFTKEDLAKFEHVWMGFPHLVSRGAQKNFVHFMQNLHPCPDGWEPTVEEYRRYIAKGIIFKEVRRIVSRNEAITAYRINVTAYTVALVADRTVRRIDLDGIWKNQGISLALQDTIETWAPAVFNHLPEKGRSEGHHIEESFKKPACWQYIRSLKWDVPTDLQKELVSSVRSAGASATILAATNSGLNNLDHNNIALCKELDEAQWLKITKWGQETGEIDEWNRGIARTLAGYAAEGWRQAPSVKQAKRGAAMIEKARKAGMSGNES